MEEKIIQDLTEKYLPFHNLLKKKQIEEYISCAEKNKKEPLKFFNEYRSIQRNHDSLFSNIFNKIGICEVQNSECGEKCKMSFNDEPKELDTCLSDCFSKFKVCADFEYGSFYKLNLKKYREWNLVKKNLN